MFSTVYSAATNGIDGYLITVECNADNRMPHLELVGLPDAAVKESKERVRMKQVTRTEKQGAREENRRALMQNRSKDNKSQNEKKSLNISTIA